MFVGPRAKAITRSATLGSLTFVAFTFVFLFGWRFLQLALPAAVWVHHPVLNRVQREEPLVGQGYVGHPTLPHHGPGRQRSSCCPIDLGGPGRGILASCSRPSHDCC